MSHSWSGKVTLDYLGRPRYEIRQPGRLLNGGHLHKFLGFKREQDDVALLNSAGFPQRVCQLKSHFFYLPLLFNHSHLSVLFEEEGSARISQTGKIFLHSLPPISFPLNFQSIRPPPFHPPISLHFICPKTLGSRAYLFPTFNQSPNIHEKPARK